LGRGGKEVKAGSGKARQHLHSQSLAGHHADHLGRPQRFVTQYYKKVQQNPKSKDWRDCPTTAADGAVLRPTVTIAFSAASMTSSRRRPPPRHQGSRIRLPHDSGSRRSRRPFPAVDEVKGRVPVVYISLKPGVPTTKAIEDRVIHTIETMIGKIARPKTIHIVRYAQDPLWQIMRRVLAAISNQMDTGDITTLANPDISPKSANKSKPQRRPPQEGPEDIKRFRRRTLIPRIDA